MAGKKEKLGKSQIVIDLKETTSIDAKGIELLSAMSQAAVRLLTSGVLMKYLLKDFRKATKISKQKRKK